MRHEIVAFANSFKDQALPTTQIYPTCINFNITGGTGEVTPEAVQLQGFYDKGMTGIPQEEIVRGDSFTMPGPPLTPGLGNSPSEDINSGTNDNPKYDSSQEELNEPSDDNDTVPNSHLDWFERVGVPAPAPGEPVNHRMTKGKLNKNAAVSF
ncbi:hypothetical protein ABW20_dc0106012 [Dactylellina cionopaga]|nr:hypothetical protein ABW20_dc0106012 [Dactylellina cionopaga]